MEWEVVGMIRDKHTLISSRDFGRKNDMILQGSTCNNFVENNVEVCFKIGLNDHRCIKYIHVWS